MDTTEITHLSLCSGYGGLDLGIKGVFGENCRTVAYAEIEAFAVECLLARMEGGQLDAAPIWPNLKSFPWEAFSDRVDILSGGYPCQPFSAAGKRLGTEDPRHLWPFIANGIRIMRPKLCFFENVEGHISLGLREVVGELESMGYKVSWGIFSAREVGAPHQRKRVFILAYREGERLPKFANIGAVWREVCTTSVGSQLANNKGQRIQGHRADWLQEPSAHVKQALPVRGGKAGGNAWPSSPGEPQHEWEPPRVVGNTKELRRPRLCKSLAANLNQQITLLADANSRQAQPALGRDVDGTASGLDYAKLCISGDNRTDELRLLGNGVVPATATKAFLTLLEDLIK